MGSKPRVIAGLSLPTLLSLASVSNPRAGESIYDRVVALVAQLEVAIDGLGAGTRMSEAAHVLFGLEPDTRFPQASTAPVCDICPCAPQLGEQIMAKAKAV